MIGALEAPGHDGPIMRHRHALNETLEQAARQCGAAFYNPTQLIVDHGRETVLDGGGADIHEYAPDFYPMVAKTWLDLARRERPPAKPPSRATWSALNS